MLNTAQPLSADRITRSEFDGLLNDTRAAFFAAHQEIESLRQECSTTLRRCVELHVEIDRLTQRLAPHDPAIEPSAVEHAKIVICPRCGRDIDLPTGDPWPVHGPVQNAPTLFAVRCPQCGHQIDLAS
jgi:DNA-directed RNA polymerase subunit RPC12/RpoP